MAVAFVPDLTLSSYQDVHDAFRNRHLRQALYDEGAVVMADSLIVLHGTDHRDRRRLENRLFRREIFLRWEDELLDATVERAFRPFIAEGGGDLVAMAYQTTMNLTAYVAGVDQPAGTVEETERLLAITRKFSEGATMVHTTRDPEVLRVEVLDALERFADEFLQPSIQRRQALLDAGNAEELPPDVLSSLLTHRDELDLSDEVIRREVAFYLQAGSHSTANAFTHTVDDLFRWAESHPDDLDRARSDRSFVKRCFHETLRLRPASPVAWRRAVDETQLRSGVQIDAGSLLELDLATANTDAAVWGSDGAGYDPNRIVPDGVPPWGHSFGGGRHICIGMELDGGTAPDQTEERELFGTVAVMVAHLLGAGGHPDPDASPTLDPNSQRVQFSAYPVVFDATLRSAHTA